MAEHDDNVTITAGGLTVAADGEILEEIVRDAKAGLTELRATGDSITFRGTFKSALIKTMRGRGGVEIMGWIVRVNVNEDVREHDPRHVARMLEEPAMVSYRLPAWRDDPWTIRGFLDDVRVDGRRVWLMDLPPEELGIAIVHYDHEMGREGWVDFMNFLKMVNPLATVTVTVRALQPALL